MKTYIIYLQRSGILKPLIERLGLIGDRVFLDTGLYLVKSDETSVDILGKLAAPPFDNMEIFVAELKPEDGNIYGAVRNANIWRFLGLLDEPNEENAQESTNNTK